MVSLKAKLLGVALAAITASLGWAHPAAGNPFTETVATFENPGFFVTMDDAFEPLRITPLMLIARETDIVRATVLVHASAHYTLRVEIDDADLAGSQLNPNHPRGLDPRDAFLFSVTDSDGLSSPWHTGSQPIVITGQPATLGVGQGPALHRIDLKLQFGDGDGNIFAAARPGTYTASLIIEVEEDSL